MFASSAYKTSLKVQSSLEEQSLRSGILVNTQCFGRRVGERLCKIDVNTFLRTMCTFYYNAHCVPVLKRARLDALQQQLVDTSEDVYYFVRSDPIDTKATRSVRLGGEDDALVGTDKTQSALNI